MRKFFIALLLGTTILTTAACSNGSTESSVQASDASTQTSVSSTVSTAFAESSEASTASKADETSAQQTSQASVDTKDIEKYVDVDKLGEKTKNNVVNVIAQDKMKLSISGEIAMTSSAAVKTKLNVTVMKDKDNVCLEMKMGEEGFKIIKNDKGSYMVNDSSKTAAFQPASDESSADTSADLGAIDPTGMMSSIDLSTLTYKGNGNEEYSGTKYDYEEYDIDGSTVKFYFDGDKPVMLVGDDENGTPTVLNIEEISNNVSEDSFTVPKDYKITDAASMFGLGSDTDSSKSASSEA